MIKRKTIDEIYAAVQVEDIIEDYVNLKRRGVNMIGLCPFHNEKTPSFTVSPAKNLYKCFGCGKGGGPVNFLMEHETFTYPEALRHLAQKYNIKIEEEEQSDEALLEQQKRESLILINGMASSYFEEQLLKSDEGKSIGLSYLKHRGLNEATIDTFNLGYSPRESKHFTTYAIDKGYNIDLLKELGLTSTNGYDFYRERVIFPFHNLSGKVIGFGGRILKENVKAPKYLNSPESELYNKRKTLYGLYQARTAIRKEDACILVEGYTDVLSLHQSDIKNVVASSGTSLTIDQVGLIKRFTENAIVLYDGDAAGQKAALRGLDIFLDQGLNVTVVMLPEGQDPDSYVKELGTTKFSEFIKETGQDFILRLANYIQDNFKSDPVNKSIQIKELVKSMSLIRDQIKRSLYVKECANILKMEERTLFVEINKNIKTELNKKSYQRPPTTYAPPKEKYVDYDPNTDHSQGVKIKIDTTDYQELDVIRILIAAGHEWYNEEENLRIGQYLIDKIDGRATTTPDETFKIIYAEYQEGIDQDRVTDQTFWTNHQNDDVRKVAIDILSERHSYAEGWSKKGLLLQTQKPLEENYKKDADQAIYRMQLKSLKERIGQLDKLIINESDPHKLKIYITAKAKYIEQRKEVADQGGQIIN